MDNNPKLLAYANIYATQHAEKDGIRDFLTEQMGTDDWQCHTLNISDIPVELYDTDSVLSQHFYSGIATANWLTVQRGGNHINPMMVGLNVDFESWFVIMSEQLDFSYTLQYIDIPYEVYQRCCPLEEQVEEDQYQASSEVVKTIVDNLTDEKLRRLH